MWANNFRGDMHVNEIFHLGFERRILDGEKENIHHPISDQPIERSFSRHLLFQYNSSYRERNFDI
jgi:hypothetical protein